MRNSIKELHSKGLSNLYNPSQLQNSKENLKKPSQNYIKNQQHKNVLNIVIKDGKKQYIVEVKRGQTFKNLKKILANQFIRNQIDKIWFETENKNYAIDYQLQSEIGIINTDLILHIFRINNHYIRHKSSFKAYVQNFKLIKQQSKFRNTINRQNIIPNRGSFRNSNKSMIRHSSLISVGNQPQNNQNSFKGCLNDYKVLKCISIGGFSKVFLVRSKKDGMFYAAKFLEKQRFKDIKQIKIINNEIQINQQISHPSIVKMNQYIQTKNFFILVMEYCPGGQLFHQLKTLKNVDEEEAKTYFIEIFLAIQYLHSKNIIFRDVKPQNILLDAFGHVKLTDFGLAKKLKDTRDKTYSYCGSLEYMSPQIIMEKGHSFEVDYYCLGVLLYEIILGYPPFYNPDISPQLIKRAIATQNPTFPSQINISQEIKDFILKLLKKNPKERLGSLGGCKQILCHPWIGKIKREDYLARKLNVPIIPKLQKLNFDQSDFGVSQERFSKKVLLESKKYRKINYDSKKQNIDLSIKGNKTIDLYKKSKSLDKKLRINKQIQNNYNPCQQFYKIDDSKEKKTKLKKNEFKKVGIDYKKNQKIRKSYLDLKISSTKIKFLNIKN